MVSRPGVKWGLGAIGLAAILLAGCGGYYYKATVQGFVVDDQNGQGINEATVRLYTSEPSTADDEGYVALTSTFTQGGTAGYYSSAVIWSNLFGSYGREGDTTTVWLGITHPDYAPVILEAAGVLSDEANLAAAARMLRTTFSLSALRGRVVDVNGAGVNGVRVVLDFPVLSGIDAPEDRVTQSATIDGAAGTFEFNNVEWSESNTSDQNGEVTITLRVDDPDWGDPDTVGGPGPDYTIERAVVLVPATQTRVVPTSITVARRPRTEFTTTVTGRALSRIGDGTLVGVQGVRVTLTFDVLIDGGGSRTETRIDFTDATGAFALPVTWIDNGPGDYGDADEQTDPDPVGPGAGIASGEDGLTVTVTFGSAAKLDFGFNNADYASVEIVSNPRDGVNRLPDNVRPVP